MKSYEATGGVVSAEKKILTIDELLKFTKEQGASDLHLSEGSTPMIRIDGVMHKLELPGLDKEGIRSLLISAMDNDQRKRFEEQYEIEVQHLQADPGIWRRLSYNSRRHSFI